VALSSLTNYQGADGLESQSQLDFGI